MSVDLAFDDGQQAIAHAVAQLCADICDEDAVKASAGTFPSEMWQSLAELGMLGIATPEGDGGAIELSAAMESLGRAVFPGPLVASFIACQVVPAETRAAIVEGRSIVSLGSRGLMPWVSDADCLLEVDGGRIFEVRLTGEIGPVDTLGGEPWGRVVSERVAELEGAPRALVVGDITLAAYQAAAASALVEAACEHAAARTQFGRPIGEFQAVAHPLADCSMRLGAATMLARNAAFVFDEAADDPIAEARILASAARLSSNAAALEAAYVCHQVFGAIGITLEGPAFHITRRIRQLASQPPGPSAAREELLASFGLGSSAPA